MSETMIRKNHMDVLWHEYTDKEGQNLPIVQASLTEKASIIGRAGIMPVSYTHLGYKVEEKCWSKEQLDILGIPEEMMPRIVKPWDIIGHLTEEIAQKTGLPAGIPICGGAGDTMQSMIGSGNMEPGQAVDVAGTCSMFCVSTKGIIPEPVSYTHLDVYKRQVKRSIESVR